MRAAILALLLVGACGGSHRQPASAGFSVDTTPFPAKPWPAEGMCVDFDAGCRVFTPAEIAAIKQTVLDHFDPALLSTRPDLARARELASWPISTPMIGGYRASTPRNYPPQAGPVLELVGTAHSQDNLDSGFRIYITESPPGTWTVLGVEPWVEGRPQTN